jgi:hypothetical protein
VTHTATGGGAAGSHGGQATPGIFSGLLPNATASKPDQNKPAQNKPGNTKPGPAAKSKPKPDASGGRKSSKDR